MEPELGPRRQQSKIRPVQILPPAYSERWFTISYYSVLYNRAMRVRVARAEVGPRPLCKQPYTPYYKLPAKGWWLAISIKLYIPNVSQKNHNCFVGALFIPV